MMLTAESGVRGTVYDLDTGRRVPKVIEFNHDTGYIKAYRVVRQNDQQPKQEEIQCDINGDYRWYEAHGRFKFVPEEANATVRVVMGAPACGRCGSALTLPGDELCPRCRAKETGQRNRFVVERLSTPLLDRQCESCTRTAVWSVADEVEVTPQLSSRILYGRGMTVGRRYYCDSCWEPPRLLDKKGERIRDFNYSGPDVLPKEQDDGDNERVLSRTEVGS